MCKEKDGNVTVDFDDVVIRGVTVIRAGEIAWPAPPVQVSAQPQAARKAAPEVKTEKKVPAHRGVIRVDGAGNHPFGWLASVRERVSWALHRFRAGLGLWVITWCGMCAHAAFR
ncbi:hypothetical protein ACNKHU_09630 [Shigella flexneri]